MFLRLFLGLEKLCAHMNHILSKCATQNVRNVLPPFDVHIRTSNKTRTQLVPSGKTIIILFCNISADSMFTSLMYFVQYWREESIRVQSQEESTAGVSTRWTRCENQVYSSKH